MQNIVMDKESIDLWRELLENTTNFQDRLSIYTACQKLIPCRKCKKMNKKTKICSLEGGAKNCNKW